MSSRTIGAACLVAGVTIGGGMLALPLTVSALGLIGGSTMMIVVWLVMYIAGLYGLELNLKVGAGKTLGGLGQYFSGPLARFLGDISLVVLTYALMTAYIFGGASVLKSLLPTITNWHVSEGQAIVFIMGLLLVILIGQLEWVDHYNRLLFGVMLAAMAILMVGLATQIGQIDIILPPAAWQPIAWQMAIPVVFTSFGYHIIQNTMVVYCQYDAQALKRAFFWGSLIPLIVYVTWVMLTLTILWNKNPAFYEVLLTQKAQLGAFMQVLSQAANASWLHPLSWILGFLAILTSAIGVGLAIISFWEHHLPVSFRHRYVIVGLALLPPFFIGSYIPEVFVGALGFAGMILTVIAVFMPVYLLTLADEREGLPVSYPLTQNKILRGIVVLGGLIVVGCEILNLLCH